MSTILGVYTLTSANTPLTVPLPFAGPFTIAVAPGAGDTVSIGLSLDQGNNYVTWAPGAVTAAANAQVYLGMTPGFMQMTLSAGTANSTIVVSQ